MLRRTMFSVRSIDREACQVKPEVWGVGCSRVLLRKVLNNRQWRLYMALEEAVIDRVLEETNVLVTWAFDEGGLRQGSRCEPQLHR